MEPLDKNHLPNHQLLMDFLSTQPHNVRIIEEVISIHVQERFLKLAQKLQPDGPHRHEQSEIRDSIMGGNLSMEETEYELVQLAFTGEIEDYRFLENYHLAASSELRDFARFACLVSRIRVESELTGNPPSLISTGLGGKGNRLRYIMAIFPNFNGTFSETQARVIQNEWEETGKTFDIENEKIRFLFEYAFIQALVPITVDLNTVAKEFIRESNRFGNFIYQGYFLTNVAIPTHREILRFKERITQPHI
jgi:hypothetical protein